MGPTGRLLRATADGRNAVWIWDPRRQSPVARQTWEPEADANAPGPIVAPPGHDAEAEPDLTPTFC